MKKWLLIGAACLALGACQTTPEQALYDARTDYAETQARVFKYVTLPACPEAAPACHDPAAKAELKAQADADAAVIGSGATASAIEAADAANRAILSRHEINCGAAATDSCP